MKADKIHIGKIVEKAFNQSDMSKADFARSIGVLPQNLNREFQNDDWSVIKLISAGIALKFDFSPLFEIDDAKREIQKSKVILQIEVDDDKVNEVLKLVQDKKLYNLLKK